MTRKSLRPVLALVLALIVAASAKNVPQPEQLNTSNDVHASDHFNPIQTVQQAVSIGKGIIAAIIIGVLLAVVGIIVCCVCMCRACASKKEVHTVVYTGHPNQVPPQQPQHQQWPPGAQPTTPPQAYCPPPQPPHYPGPVHGQQSKF